MLKGDVMGQIIYLIIWAIIWFVLGFIMPFYILYRYFVNKGVDIENFTPEESSRMIYEELDKFVDNFVDKLDKR